MQPNSRNARVRRLICSQRAFFTLGLAALVVLGLLACTQSGFAADIVASCNVDETIGTITPSGPQTVAEGGSLQFTAAVTPAGAAQGYRFKYFQVIRGSSPSQNFTDNPHTVDNITGPTNVIVAVFDYVYTITASVSGPGGTISPAGPTNVNYQGSQVITITPDAGYQVSNVLVDGVSVGAVTFYTFSNVTADHTIVASFTAGSHSLTLLFDQSAYPGNVWLQAEDSTQGFQATYGSGQNIIFQNPGDMMSVPVKLSDIGAGGLTVTYANGVFLFLFYDDPSGMSRTAAPAYMSVPQRFMPIELTMTGGSGDQGDLEAINYFTAPLSLRSYSTDPTQSPTPPWLQKTGFGGATAGRIAGQLLRYCQRNPNAVVTNAQGRIIRILGPSDAFTPNPNPWPSFIPYTLTLNGQNPTQIQPNPQGFEFTDKDPVYYFGANMTATADNQGNLTVTGDITVSVTGTIKAGNPTPPASWSGATISFSVSDPDAFNSAIYGSVENTAVTFSGTAWDDFETFCKTTLYDPTQAPDPVNNPSLADNIAVTSSAYGPNAPAYKTAKATFIGEVTTGLLGGFFNSSYPSNYPPDNGAALKSVPSNHWWLQNPMVAFSQIQPQHPYYSLYSEVIFNISGNTVYGVPYSDRFGQGPLVNTVNYTKNGNTYYVNYWVIGIGAPLPQGIAIAPEIMPLLDNP